MASYVDISKSSTVSQNGVSQKIYLFGDELILGVVFYSFLHALGTGTVSSSREICASFSSGLIVHETTPKLDWYLQGYGLKEFLRQS